MSNQAMEPTPPALLMTSSQFQLSLAATRIPAAVAHLVLVRPMKIVLGIAAAILLCAADWPPAKSPAVADADGYVIIPNAALSPNKETRYRAVFDATRAAAKPTELLPALNMAASELNALATVGAPLANAKFVVVFHGSAVDGILRNEQYKAKFGTENPNLAAIREMKKAGVEFFVCGQYLAGEKIDPKTLLPEVTLAADALLVLMHYQNNGYALMSF